MLIAEWDIPLLRCAGAALLLDQTEQSPVLYLSVWCLVCMYRAITAKHIDQL